MGAQLGRATRRFAGGIAFLLGLVVSAYAFVEIEVFAPGRLVYHLLWASWQAPTGIAGTQPWPFSPCWEQGPPGYGIPGASCVFPNYDGMLLLFALVMGAGAVVLHFDDASSVGLPRRQRLWRAVVTALRDMSYYSTLVFGWCIVLFGALPTWDQSVIWASSPTWSYPAVTWDPITNTCLVPFPGHTSLWPSCWFPNFLECLLIAAGIAGVTSTAVARWRSSLANAPGHEAFTVDRYNAAIRRSSRRRAISLGGLVAGVVGFQAIFWGTGGPGSTGGDGLRWLTVSWLLPLPLVVAGAAAYFAWFSADRFTLPVDRATRRAGNPRTLIFQLTSSGGNPETAANSLRSVLYWTRRHRDLPLRIEVWLCVDEGVRRPPAPLLEWAVSEGIRVVETPAQYRTTNGTTGKGRALQYAVELRRRLFPDLSQVFVYHQDDETMTGEDTLVGLEAFIAEHGDAPSVGAGIILYPQRAQDARPSQVQEFGRTHDDLRMIMSLSGPRNLLGGYHGSHFVARADVEDRVGFDIGPRQTTEDFVFEIQVRNRFGSIFHLLRGFAYEQAPLSIADQLRQRRRWICGWLRAYAKVPLGPVRRLVMLYRIAAWLSAGVSLVALAASLALRFSPVFAFSGGIAGLVWGSLALSYANGYSLSKGYTGRLAVPSWRILLNGAVGLLVDGLAPWYAIVSRGPREFEVIGKDRAHPPSLPSVLARRAEGPMPRVAGAGTGFGTNSAPAPIARAASQSSSIERTPPDALAIRAKREGRYVPCL